MNIFCFKKDKAVKREEFEFILEIIVVSCLSESKENENGY